MMRAVVSRLSKRTARGTLLAAALLVAAPVHAQPVTPAPVRPAAPAPAPGARPAPAPAPGAATDSRVPEVMRPTATIGPAPGQGSGGSGAMVVPPSGTATAPGGTAMHFPGLARFLSVARPDAVLYDAPSEKANRVFLGAAGMPVEVVSVLRNWVKIRDADGDLTWALRDDLTDRRMVVANAVVPLRREPQPLAAAWFNLDRGVIVELLDERPVNGFVRVKYVEGQIGWLPQAQVWGL